MKLGKSMRTVFHYTVAAIYSIAFVVPAYADGALPTGGQVVAGSAAISTPGANDLLVTQSSSKAIIDWSSFSIGNGNSVHFDNGTGDTLSRVTGASFSSIDGLLSATGSVYLLNPNGVIVGKNGVVNVGGGFVASTLDVSNAQFLAGGDLTFSGGSNAAVVNYGKVGALGGDVALIAAKVDNEGAIDAPNGTAALASGYEVLMRDASLDDGKFVVKVGGADTSATNVGTIRAADAELRANGGNVYALSGNTKGIVQATGVSNNQGHVFLTAENASVTVAGDISAKRANGDGGQIVATADNVTLKSGAALDASGNKGGTILVGGDAHGGADATTKLVGFAVENAKTATVESGAALHADGASGNGGKIVVWSDNLTMYLGDISATGSGAGGNGGFAEVSGHDLLGFEGSADLTSQNGETGTLLLDPISVTISTGTTTRDTLSAGTYTPNGTSSSASIIKNSDLTNALKTANIIVTTGSTGTQVGDILISAAIAWTGTSGATTLTLQAARNITINSAITSATGGLILNAPGTITQNSSGTLSVAQLSLLGAGATYTLTNANNVIGTLAANTGNVNVAGKSNLAVGTVGSTTGITASGAITLSNTGNIAINNAISSTGSGAILVRSDSGGTGVGAVTVGASGSISTAGSAKVYYNPANNPVGSVVNATSYTNQPSFNFGGGGTFAAYMFVNSLADLQNMQNNTSASYALSKDIDAGATAGWNSGAGFAPIANFTGNFDGQNHTISGLTINRSSANYVGLFGSTQNATIANIGLLGGSITGANWVGSLVGSLKGGSVSQAYSTAAVIGGYYVGGLIGQIDLGGGAVSSSYATGSVSGLNTVGGLVGQQNSGSVDHSFATGTVGSTGNAGGLVGSLSGGASINQSYATGPVNGFNITGGLVGFSTGDISQSYSSGAVNGSYSVGGLIGYYNSGAISSSYWDTTTSGQSVGFGYGAPTGATGLTSAQFANKSNFSGWTFGSTAGSSGWVIIDGDSTLNNAGGAVGATRPMFLSLASTTGIIINGFQLQLMALDLNRNYGLGGNIDLSSLGLSSASGLWFGNGFVSIGSATAVGTGLPVITETGPYSVPLGTANEHPFTGSFDGKNFTISNLFINRPTTDYVGLFGYVTSDGSKQISNLTLSGGSVTGRDRVGGLIGGTTGYDSSGNGYVLTLDTITSSVNVTGRDFVGGIGGALESIYMYAPTVSGTVTGRDIVGGIAGYDSSSSGFVMENATNGGNVFGRNIVGGLFGYLGTGIYDDNVSSGNVTATGDNVGGMFGILYGGTYSGTYATTGNVIGNNNVGGMVGWSQGDSIEQAYATGAVNGNNNVGGLVGFNDTGSLIEASFASGIVHGVDQVGGLVGRNLGLVGAFSGVIGAYATGAVYGTSNVGGLVGNNATFNEAPTTYVPAGFVANGTIANSYSIGYVNGTTNVGGLVGNNMADSNPIGAAKPATVKNSFFNTETSGQSAGIGAGIKTGTSASATGKTTTQMQSMAIGTGTGNYAWLTSAWGIVTGVTYPYFKWLYTSAPQAITGKVYNDNGATVLPGVGVNMQINGVSSPASTVGSSGANGAYYFLVPGGTLAAAGKQVLVYTSGANGGATFQEKVTATIGNINIYGTYFREFATSASTTLSAVTSDLALALGSNTATQTFVAGLANREINITALSFAIDQAINANTLILSSAGSVSQTAGITATSLLLGGSGSSYALNQATNSIGTLAANTGAISVVSSGALIVGGVAGTNGVTSTGDVTLTSGDDLTIASTARVTTAANRKVVLSAAGDFVNNRGSDAVGVSGTGRWLIYSSAPGGDVFGNLNSGNTAIWNATYATLAPGSVTANGNRYLFGMQPVLTIKTTDATKTYGDDGASAIAAAYGVSGYQAGVANAYLGDNAASVFTGFASVDSTGAAVAATVNGGPYAINASAGTMAVLNGYAFAFANNGLLTVNPATLSVIADAQTKIYGALDPTLTWSASGFKAGDDETVVVGDLDRASGETVAGGPYGINAGTLDAGSNYTLAFTGAALTITPATLTVTANAQTKTYGALDPTLSYGVTGYQLSDDDTVFSGTLDRAAGETVAGGPYAINAGTLDAGPNYTLAFTGADLTITPATLTVTANAQTKTYGALDPTLSYAASGYQLSDDDTVFSGALDRASGETVAGGPYAINAGTLDAGSNYTLDFTGAALTITPATLTVTANAQTKVYGASDPTLSYAASGYQLSDDDTVFSGTLDRASGETVSGGPYAINAGTLEAGSNYTLDFTGADLTITPATLTVTANAQTKTYGAADPTLSYGATGYQLSDDDTVFSGTLDRASGETVAGGPYAINVGTLDAGSNYTLDFTGADLTINPATLTVTANAQAKVYGASDPTLTWSASGYQFSDDESVVAGSLDRASGETVAGGPYAINAGSLTVNSNYTLDFTGADLTVNPATLTVTANAQTKVYGASDPTLAYAASGYQFSDDETVFSGALDRVSGETVAGGPYAIGQGGLSAGSNYTISFTGNALAITPATLTVAANAQTKIYGALDPTLSYAASGYQFSDDDGVFTGALGRAAGERVAGGPYAINVGSLDAGSNYTLDFTGADLTINPATLTVTANAQTKVYGASDPTLTWSASGFQSGDPVSIVTGSLDRASGETVAGGPYAINVGSLDAGSNYTLDFTGADLTINPATLTIAANTQTKIYGASDPTLTWAASGFQFSDDESVVTGALDRASGETVAGGPYAIDQGSLATNTNYTIAFTGNDLTITPATLTVAANAQTKIYGASDPTLSYSASGFQFGDDDGIFSGVLDRAAGETVAGGPYAIGQGALSAGSNYSIAFTDSDLTITPATLTVAANAQTKVYGALDPTLSYVASGFQFNDDETSVLTGGLVRAAGENVVGGPYAIGQGTLAANTNYTLAFTSDALTITPRPVTITADNKSKVIGDTDPALTWSLTSGSFVNGDSATGALHRAAGDLVGDYAIDQGSLGLSSNYVLAFVDGMFTVQPLTHTPGNVTPPQPGSDQSPGGSTPGTATTAGGEPSDDTTGSIGDEKKCGATGSCPAGPYPANSNPAPGIIFVSQ